LYTVIITILVFSNWAGLGTSSTDVPSFIGASRKKKMTKEQEDGENSHLELPEWLLSSMIHSHLFDAWRVQIVTFISYFNTNQNKSNQQEEETTTKNDKGGELVLYINVILFQILSNMI